MTLPAYEPPSARHANVAAAVAPLLLVLGFALVLLGWVDPSTWFALFAACSFWLVYEVNHFENVLARYDGDYVERHLAWRSDGCLQSLADADGAHAATRDFVLHFLAADRRERFDGQTVV